MKVYISADMEGVGGSCDWEDVRLGSPTYSEHRERMHQEVLAACRGAFAAGAKEIVVKDAHATGRNLDPARLPSGVSLIRGWSGHPSMMVQDIDQSYDAVLFVGYHAAAGSDANPLAHTMSSSRFGAVHLNDQLASEFMLHSLYAAEFAVPSVFVSGDAGLCDHVRSLNATITTVATLEGSGCSTTSPAQCDLNQSIEDGVKASLASRGPRPLSGLSGPWRLVVEFKRPELALAASFFPGAEKVAQREVAVSSDQYFEMMRAIMFFVCL